MRMHRVMIPDPLLMALRCSLQRVASVVQLCNSYTEGPPASGSFLNKRNAGQFELDFSHMCDG